MVVLDELKLRPRFRAAREPLALLDHLPLFGDELQRMPAVPRHTRVDKPAADDEPSAAYAASAVHGAYPAALLVVPEHVEDLADEVDALGQTAIADGEVVVLDLLRVDAEGRAARREVGVVREELVWLGEVDEGAHAGLKEGIQLLLRLLAGEVRWGKRAIRKLACHKVLRSPVGVRYGSRPVAQDVRGGGARRARRLR